MSAVQITALVHILATAFMTGLIWFVQVVHYPLFARVGPGEFTDYEREHQFRTTGIVGPAMLMEAGSAIALVWLTWGGGGSAAMAWVGIGLLLIIWGSTFILQVPCHQRLAKSFSTTIVARLTLTNWIRTAAWSARTIVAALILRQVQS